MISDEDRVESYPLLGSSKPVITILAMYLIFIYYLGPKLMENRKPFKLKGLMMFYNTIQIIGSGTVGIYGYYWTYHQNHFKFRCQEANFSASEQGYKEFIATYSYFILKILDLSDTIFFVLRKKNAQISILHVYHHVIMFVIMFIGSKYIPAGHLTLIGIINCFVHVVMYFYYLVSSVSSKLIWWKKYLTQIQILQFTAVQLHALNALLRNDCKYPKSLLSLTLLINFTITLFFCNFYYHAYIKKKKN